MKKCLIILGLLGLAVVARADAGFLKTLPADDFASAGLQKQTPEELARLEALVQLYKTGELSVMRQKAEAEASARQLAEQKIIAAEQKARDAEAKAREVAQQARDAEAKAGEAARKNKETATQAEAVPGKKQPGWFAALLTLKRAGEKPAKEEPLVSRLDGDFSGWSGRTVFKLQNGTQWVQQNKTDSYVFSPALHSPNVKITPAALSGFWLEVEGANMKVRVEPIELLE